MTTVSDADEKMNRAIRLVAGRNVEEVQAQEEMDEVDRQYRPDLMSESERRLYDQWRRGRGMRTNADVNAWIRRQAGRQA